ncbi:MAG: alpha/beta fold hydrolase, partial [Polyangia bacterium]|nr:alpha/beta fold hydrolase [Polyangia bacterium]
MAFYHRGTGPAIVLLHGMPTSCYLWRDVVASLQRNFQVVAPDLLGLGDTFGPMDVDHSLQGQASLLVGLLGRLEIEEAVLVGHDIGGAVAQILALELPRRVRGLVLVASAAYDNWPVPVIRMFQRLAEHPLAWRMAIRAGIMRKVGLAEQGFRRGVHFPGSLRDEDIDEYLRPSRLSSSSREHLRRLLISLDNRETQQLGHRLGEIECPSLVLWGAEDAFLSPHWGRRLRTDLR